MPDQLPHCATESVAFVLMGKAGHCSVCILNRLDPKSQDFWDANWLSARVELKSAGFRGDCEVTLRAEAFVEFRDQLLSLIEKGKGVARFAPIEPALTIGVQRDCFETAEAVISLKDNLDAGNELRARFRVDSKCLPMMIEELNRIVEAFPVVGR